MRCFDVPIFDIAIFDVALQGDVKSKQHRFGSRVGTIVHSLIEGTGLVDAIAVCLWVITAVAGDGEEILAVRHTAAAWHLS